jgi:hypothetical protein
MKEAPHQNSSAMLLLREQKTGQYGPVVGNVFPSTILVLMLSAFVPSVEQTHVMSIFKSINRYTASARLTIQTYCVSSILIPSAISLHACIPTEDLSSSNSSRCTFALLLTVLYVNINNRPKID